MTKCKNCGADEGIHHYKTDQCPVGGFEAPVGKEQEWKTSTFEADIPFDPPKQMTNGSDGAFAAWATWEVGQPGCTKRELFAAMAMQGLLAGNNSSLKKEELTQFAVSHADSLVAALNANQGGTCKRCGTTGFDKDHRFCGRCGADLLAGGEHNG